MPDDRHVRELRAPGDEIGQRVGIHAELAAGGQARQHAHVLSLRGRGRADEVKVQRALGREQVCAQRDGARNIVRALVHAGVQDALRRDAEPFADRQFAGGAHLHPAEHVRQAAQHEGVGLHGVAQIYVRAERGAHSLSARREGLQIKQIQRRAVFRGCRSRSAVLSISPRPAGAAPWPADAWRS